MSKGQRFPCKNRHSTRWHLKRWSTGGGGREKTETNPQWWSLLAIARAAGTDARTSEHTCTSSVHPIIGSILLASDETLCIAMLSRCSLPSAGMPAALGIGCCQGLEKGLMALLTTLGHCVLRDLSCKLLSILEAAVLMMTLLLHVHALVLLLYLLVLSFSTLPGLQASPA